MKGVAVLVLVLTTAGCVAPQPTAAPPSTYFPSILSQPTWTPYPTRVPVAIVPGNLLIDPSLEGPYTSDGVHPEVNTSIAWKAWYSCKGDLTLCVPPCDPNQPGCDLPCPSNCTKENGKCQSDYGCYWARPEFNPFDFDKAAYRVHSGNMAQVYFTYGRMGRGGIYQTVSVTAGTLLRFTAYMQAWQCFDYGSACDWGRLSDKPSDMHLRIGIDPTGGTDVNSADIVWSPEREAYDRWVEFSVTARAQSSRVTVFTSGGATFDYARKNNDVYIDDLALVQIRNITDTPTPTMTYTPTPTTTPTPGPPTVTPGATWTPAPGVTLTCQLTLTQRVYVLLPPGSGREWYTAAVPVAAEKDWSIGTSAVDACLNSCARRIVIAVNVEQRGCNLYPACRAPCGSLSYIPLSAPTPADLAQLLERYPAWLREAWGICMPSIMRSQ